MSAKRNILAAFLIFGIFLLIPKYLEMVGVAPEINCYLPSGDIAIVQTEEECLENGGNLDGFVKKDTPAPQNKNNLKNEVSLTPALSGGVEPEVVTIETEWYRAVISNKGGGSIVKYELIKKDGDEFKYHGTYTQDGRYTDKSDTPVALIHQHPDLPDVCAPCLGTKTSQKKYNQPFTLENPPKNNFIYVSPSDGTITLTYSLGLQGGDYIKKDLVIDGKSLEMQSFFNYSLKETHPQDNVEILWTSGVFPTEPPIGSNTSFSQDELNYSSVYAYQDGSLESITQYDSDDIDAERFDEDDTDWIAIRTKFFGMAMIPSQPADYVNMSSKNLNFRSDEDVTPIYSAALGGYLNYNSSLHVTTFLGPLDVEHIDKLADGSVSDIMNFGWSIIKPFSRFVLWVVKSLHDILPLNYGFILIIIALLMRFITSPLTRKSYESAAKMKVVAPLQKEIQEKYKGNPQKVQQEMAKLWKEHGVNPVSGCLPMLVQWPILMAFFIVFRSTIEFRGEPFIFWIKDLSQPDFLFSLPFSIPVYGESVAILPILMGISMFLTMRITMASTEGSQKTFMYFMNGFFILIFNSFPSGLTLYYTIFNFLSYQQQLSIKNSKK